MVPPLSTKRKHGEKKFRDGWDDGGMRETGLQRVVAVDWSGRVDARRAAAAYLGWGLDGF